MSEKSIQSLATFTSSLSKDGRSDERELTERQQSFLDNLINTGGDPKEAAELAGYAEGSYTQVVKSLKREIIELASQILAQSAPQAALKLVDTMNADHPIPLAYIKLQAAQTILDRIGLGKTEHMDVHHRVEGGVFILPAKNEIVIEAQYEEN